MTDARFPSTGPDHGLLRHMGAHFALVVSEAQEQFAAWIGEATEFSFDASHATLTIGTRTIGVQMLGTFSKQTGTWLWAWANAGYSDPQHAEVTQAVRWLRDECQPAQTFWQVRTPQFPITADLVDGGIECWPLFYACFAWLHSPALYSFDYGPGRAFFAVFDDQVPTPVPDPTILPRLLIDATVNTALPSMELLEVYAQWHGLSLTREANTATLHLGQQESAQDEPAQDESVQRGSAETDSSPSDPSEDVAATDDAATDDVSTTADAETPDAEEDLGEYKSASDRFVSNEHEMQGRLVVTLDEHDRAINIASQMGVSN